MSDLEFTGERFIPGQGGVQLAYEHLHRYLFALNHAFGKDVLDVASGSGFGSALLAGVAQRVWALDIDGTAISHARKAFPSSNLCFIQADGGCLPFPDAKIDLLLAFEVIEHIRDQEGMIRELARVLKPDGLALISTPDKASYSEARQYVNPYHVREFYLDEFREMLGSVFASVRVLKQQVRAGSLISGDRPASSQARIVIDTIPGGEKSETAPMYFLACCGKNVRDGWPEDSAYFDPSDSLLREWEDRLRAAGTTIDRLNEEISELGHWGRELEGEVQKRDETLKTTLGEIERRDQMIVGLQESMVEEIRTRDQIISRLQDSMAQEIESRDRIVRQLQDEVAHETSLRDQTIRNLQEDFNGRTKWVFSLQEEVNARDERIKAVSDHLENIQKAFPYRLLRRLKILPD